MSSRDSNTPNSAIQDQGREDSELHELADSIILKCKQSRPSSIIETAISVLRLILDLRPPPHPLRSDALRHLSRVLLIRFQQWGWKTDIDEALMLMIEASGETMKATMEMPVNILEVPGNDTTVQIGTFDNEVQAETIQVSVLSFAELCQPVESSSINIAIHLYNHLLLSRPPTNPNRGLTLFNLSDALVMRFQLTGQITDLQESISRLREAIHLRSPPDPERLRWIMYLSAFLCMRFSWSGQRLDIMEAVSVWLEVEKEDEEARDLFSSGTELLEKFSQFGAVSDLDTSVASLCTSLSLRPAPHPNRSTSLNNLAAALLGRSEQKGELADLEKSIALSREALVLEPTPHPDRSGSLHNLASALLTRFEQKSQLVDLEESIVFHREALVLRPAPHPDRSGSLNNIANSLRRRFQQNGQLADLEESIAFLREAMILTSAPHRYRLGSLTNLASVLFIQFEQKGQLADLEESIALSQEALALSPALHPNRFTLLNTLANALSTRFEQKGQFVDLEESIAFLREALALRPAPHPDRSGLLNNLASALWTQFQQKGQLTDLEESIAFLREALVLIPAPHPLRFTAFNNLANALYNKFEQKGQLADLEESIAFHLEALALRPAPHPCRSSSLNNLAVALLMRFRQKGQLTDLEESIAFHREALVLRTAPHPRRSGSLINLAEVLWTRFEHMGELMDLEESMTSFCDASKYETISIIPRFHSSRRWAYRAASVRHSSAMEAYQYTINLLPRLASLDLNIRQRQEVLSRARGLACDACSYAIQEGQLDKAVEFLSAGRAVFWAQALQLRTPIDDLQSHAPQLADKLRRISRALEAASAHDTPHFTLDNLQQIRDLEKEATYCRILNDDWNHTLEEVRNLEGFDDFLLPKSISKLQKASYNGPVVILNATTSGCDALVLVQDRVKHIQLPNISIGAIRALVAWTRMALSSNWVYSDISAMINDALQALPEAIRADCRHVRPISKTGYAPHDLFKFILSMLWLTVAHPIIDGLNLKKDNLTRIWWCPTGPFSFLPIHAAGIFEGDHQECLSDYAISSYIPTLDALLSSPPPKIHAPKMLVAIQPEMPGDYSRNLPDTIKELDMIERHVPKAFLTKLGTKDTPTSVEKVLSHLLDASFAHFACHGSQDPVNPLDSALLLGDGHLKVSKIMQHAIPNAFLAFLSACETAKGDENSPDEAMHLAATMLFAGFRGVVGTMWSIYDEDAPEVVDVFYHHIFRTGQAHPDVTMAAEALHIAVNKLRKEKKVSFQRWIPFIHLGL